jgi:hypothetical protein
MIRATPRKMISVATGEDNVTFFINSNARICQSHPDEPPQSYRFFAAIR